MDIKKILDNIDKIDFSKMADGFNKEIEKWTWKNEGNFLIFLNELVEYIKENKSINSDSFLYSDKEIPFVSKGEYSKYLGSLVDKMFDYCNKYELPLINTNIEENLYFNDLCLLFKYNEILYKVERMSGQGTIDIISIYEGKDSWFIDYDSLINDVPPLNYKEIIEDILKEELLKFKKAHSNELKILGYDIILEKDDK